MKVWNKLWQNKTPTMGDKHWTNNSNIEQWKLQIRVNHPRWHYINIPLWHKGLSLKSLTCNLWRTWTKLRMMENEWLPKHIEILKQKKGPSKGVIIKGWNCSPLIITVLQKVKQKNNVNILLFKRKKLTSLIYLNITTTQVISKKSHKDFVLKGRICY